jgi:hypothetical protein
MRARPQAAVLLIVGVSVALGATAAVSAGNESSRSAQRATDDLFVQTARGGTLTPVPGRRGIFRLVLRRPHHDVTVFSDRPQRLAGSESLAAFVRRWRARGFVSDPPNAALVLADAPASRDVVILELSRPRQTRRSLSFRARLVKRASTPQLARFRTRADSRIGMRFGQASLFVDSAADLAFANIRLRFVIPRTPITGTVNSPLLVGFTSPAGQGAEIDFTEANAVQVNSPGPISFSLGISGSGFLISSSASASAVVELTVTPLQDPIVGTVQGTFNTMVTIQTPSGATFPVVASNRDRFTIPLDAAM